MAPKKAEKKYFQMLKKAGGSKRVKMAFDLYRLTRNIVKAAILNEYPGLSKKEFKRRVNRRFLNNA